MEELNRDAQLYGMTICFPTHLYFTLEEMNQFDDMPNWRDVLSRPIPERIAMLQDPALRAKLNEDFRTVRTKVFGGDWRDFFAERAAVLSLALASLLVRGAISASLMRSRKTAT